MYLCHSFCELGGTPLESVLTDLHDSWSPTPGEVVVVINQDYMTPEDIVAAVEDADIAELAYRPDHGALADPAPDDRPKPARRLPRREPRRRRAPVSPRVPGHHRGDAIRHLEAPAAHRPGATRRDLHIQPRPRQGPDVPREPLTPSRCRRTPPRSTAYRPLLRRLRECRRERDHLPNLVAVNFYRRGDLFRAVDTLNGID